MRRNSLSKAVGGVFLLFIALALAVLIYISTKRLPRPAIAPPIISVPENYTGITLPNQKSSTTTRWVANIPGYEKVVCRAFDLDMNGTMDVIFCWKEGKLVFRQWLNNTSCYEKFFYNPQDGSLVSKQLYLSAADPEGYQFSFDKLDLHLAPPTLDNSYVYDESLKEYVKKSWDGKTIRFLKNGIANVYWQKAEPLNAKLGISIFYSRSGVDNYRTELFTGRLPPPTRTIYSADYTSEGAVRSLSTRIWPSPAFDCSRPQANYQNPLYVMDTVQYGSTEISVKGMANQRRISYKIFDPNKDGNPDKVVLDMLSNIQNSYSPLDLTDNNSNGSFETVILETEKDELIADSTKDDGTYDQIRTQKKGNE